MSISQDQNTIANQEQTENIVKRILTSEVKYIIGIVIFLVGVVAPYYDIKQDVALIKQNHMAHMETMTKQIEDNSNTIKALTEKEYVLMQKLAEVDGRVKSLER
jgi:hypothetical protein